MGEATQTETTRKRATIYEIDDYVKKIVRALSDNKVDDAERLLNEVGEKYGEEARAVVVYRVANEIGDHEWIDDHLKEMLYGNSIRHRFYAAVTAETLRREATKYVGEVRRQLEKLASEAEAAIKQTAEHIENTLKRIADELKKLGQKFVELARSIERAITGRLPPKLEEKVTKRFVEALRGGRYNDAAVYADYAKVPKDVKEAVKRKAEFLQIQENVKEALSRNDYEALEGYYKRLAELSRGMRNAETTIAEFLKKVEAKEAVEQRGEGIKEAAETKGAKVKEEAEKQVKNITIIAPAEEQQAVEVKNAEGQIKNITIVAEPAKEVAEAKSAKPAMDESKAKQIVSEYEALLKKFNNSGNPKQQLKLIEQLQQMRAEYLEACKTLGRRPLDENVNWDEMRENIEELLRNRGSGLKL